MTKLLQMLNKNYKKVYSSSETIMYQSQPRLIDGLEIPTYVIVIDLFNGNYQFSHIIDGEIVVETVWNYDDSPNFKQFNQLKEKYELKLAIISKGVLF